MSRPVHQIRRQTLEFTFLNKEDGSAFQQIGPRLWEKELSSHLDNLLSKAFPPESALHFIDHLDIDLGVISLSDLTGSENNSIGRIFKEKLEEWLHKEEARSTTLPQFDSNHVIPTGELSVPKGNAVLIALAHFLYHGVLPWWYLEHSLTSPDAILLAALESDEVRTLRIISESIGKPHICDRLVNQFSHEALLHLTKKLIFHYGYFDSTLPMRLWIIFRSFGLQQPVSYISRSFWESFLVATHEMTVWGGSRSSHTSFIELFKNHLQKKILLAPKMVKTLDDEAYSRGIGPEVDDSEMAPVSSSGSNRIKIPSSEMSIDGSDFAHLLEPESLESIAIENSGLVFLWPHLKILFSALDYLEEGQFVSDSARFKAIHLLHYLATSLTNQPEHFLPLNKILCGLDVFISVPRKVYLSKKEKTEGDLLLQAVINQWSVLGKTSTEAFRQSFLNRNGILLKNEVMWTLKVEKKPYDVLLEKLPWGYGMIRLSWMIKTLVVEWEK